MKTNWEECYYEMLLDKREECENDLLPLLDELLDIAKRPRDESRQAALLEFSKIAWRGYRCEDKRKEMLCGLMIQYLSCVLDLSGWPEEIMYPG